MEYLDPDRFEWTSYLTCPGVDKRREEQDTGAEEEEEEKDNLESDRANQPISSICGDWQIM